MPMRPYQLLLAAAVTASGPALAAGPALNLVEAAIAKGYGTSCGLDMTPMPRGGYYPCIDIGPYRFVSEYGRMRGFVLTQGQPPFQIMEGSGGVSAFTVKGPWVEDLDRRVATWWSDEIEGGRKDRQTRDTESKRAAAAAAAVREYGIEKKAETPPPAQAAQPSPNVYYVMPPSYGSVPSSAGSVPSGAVIAPPASPQEIPVTGIPTPLPAAPTQGVNGGVVIAPGVVAYPKVPPSK